MSLLRIHSYTLTSGLGRGRERHAQALKSGQSGLKPQQFDTCDIACHLGEVSDLHAAVPQAFQAFDCRNHRLAYQTLITDDFLAQAQRLRERHGATRIGVFIGTSTAGIHSAELAFRAAQGQTDLPDWFDYRHTQNLYSVAEFVATVLKLRGPVHTISTACSSSAKVFAAAYRHIQMGWCDAAIVGGVDSLCLTTLYGFNSLQLVADEPCRPADAQRKGISIGEAAGFAIVESPMRASANSLPFALLGYGESGDAHHMSSPDPQGRGAASAMRSALARAQLDATQVDYINLHGTGTMANDAAEDQGVAQVFGNRTPCSSTKGFTGHTLGAAGMMEAGIALLSLEHGFKPPSLNTRTKDPAFTTHILLDAEHGRVNTVLSNSFGFGGSNCSLLFGRAT